VGKILVLHDLGQSEVERFLLRDSVEYSLFAAAPPVRHCRGCFRCWVQTPGTCVIDDRGAGFAALMATHDEVVFLSRLVFGGLSPDVKAVLDRSIGFALPFFRKLNGETHHTMRFETSPGFRYLFYGPDITEQEQETARALATANALNLGSERCSVSFFPSAQESVGALI
jgi:multimeric flavodoxin WrbA